jgi:precorrin-6A/cobalt-precorrin-6A reductase
MTQPRKLNLLILGGTSEASGLARALEADPRYAPILSLAGRTIAPILPPIPHRIGGFGGAPGLAAWLRDHAIDAMIDATHPFAAQITTNAAQAAAATSTPLLRIDRPAWHPTEADRWTLVPTTAEAAAAIGPTPRRVFLTIGQQELAPFRATPSHHYLIRSVDPPPPERRPPNSTIITARGPFDEPSERALLRAHRIEILITKNAGAAATAAKLAAARHLTLPVIMITRPPTPPIPTVDSVPAALDWLATLHDTLIPRGV